MNEIITEQNESILRVELNRPAKRNAMTSSMYVALADIFNDAAKDERTRVVLWHGAGDSFSAGNDVEDFLKNPPGPGEFSAGSANERAGRFRQTADRSRAGCRDRRGNHHAHAL